MLEFIESFFPVVLAASRDAAVLALAAGGSLLLLGKRLAPGWRHALWMLVAVRLLIPVLPSSPLSWQQLLPPESALESDRLVIDPPSVREKPKTDHSINQPALPVSPIQNPPRFPASSSTPLPVTTIGEASSSVPNSAPAREHSLSVWQWLAVAWTGGTIVFLSFIVTVTARFRRRIRRMTIATARLPEIRAILDEIARENGFRQPPRLRMTEAIHSPALTGLFRPEILLPPGIADGLSVAEFRLILLHELGHLRRRDVWTNWLLSLLQAVHWFNPFVWWAFRRTRIEAERSCDAWVLQRAGADQSECYGEALIHLLKSSAKSTAVPGVVGVIESRRDLRRRIALIGRFTGKRSRLAIAGAIVLFAGLAAVGLTQAPAEKTDPEAETEKTKKVVIRAVMRESGAPPVPDVAITLFTDKPDDEASWNGRTNASGEAIFEIPEKHRSLKASVSKDGLAPLWAWVHPPREFTFRMDVAGTFGGTVLDSKGEPIEGAVVDVDWVLNQSYIPHEDFQWPDNTRETPIITGADGSWTSGPVPVRARLRGDPNEGHRPLTLKISVSHRRHVTKALEHNLKTNFETLLQQTARIVMAPAFPINGRFVDSEGKPIGGVSVSQMLGHGRPSPRALSDENGNFALFLHPFVNRVLIVKSGYATLSKTGRVPATPEGLGWGDVELKAVDPLRIQITDPNDKPLEGVDFTAHLQGQFLNPYQLAKLTTDENGEAVWKSPLPAGDWIYTVSKKGYLIRRDLRGVAPVDGELAFTLTREIQIIGTITDAVSGEPVTQFRTSLGRKDSDGSIYWYRGRRYFRNAQGQFSYVLNEPKEIAFRIEADGYQPVISRKFDQSGTQRQFTENFSLQPKPGRRTFQILEPDGKTPAAGATLNLLGENRGLVFENLEKKGSSSKADQPIIAGPDGRVILPKSEFDGQGWIISETGYLWIDETMLKELNEGEAVRLKPYTAIEGTFMVNGKPAPDWKLKLIAGIQIPDDYEDKTDYMWFIDVTTNESGAFRTGQLVPGDEPYRIYFIDPISGKWSVNQVGQVLAEAGKTNRTSIDFDAKSRVNVRGRFVDAEGKPFAEPSLYSANIMLSSTAVPRNLYFNLLPEEDGTFLTPPIPPGKYQLSGNFDFRIRADVWIEKLAWTVPAKAIEQAKEGVYDAGDIRIEEPAAAPPKPQDGPGQAVATPPKAESKEAAIAKPPAADQSDEKVTVECVVVSDDETPVPGAEVFLSMGTAPLERAISDANGVVQFEIDSDWEKDRSISAPGLFARKAGLGAGTILLRWSDPSPDKIILTKGEPLEFRVVNLEKNPVPNLEVRVAWIMSRDFNRQGQNFGIPPRLPDGFWNTVTDENGAGVINDLPDGAWIYLDHDDARFAQFPGKHTLPMHHNPALGEVAEIRASPPATIRGVVTDPDGRPGAGIVVKAFESKDWATGGASVDTVTNNEGRYELQRLLPTAYEIWAELPEGSGGNSVSPILETVRVRKRESIEDLDIKLVKGALVTGKVTLDDTGEPARGVRVWARFENFSTHRNLGSVTTGEDGTYRLRLPPGYCKVSLSQDYPGYARPHPNEFLYQAEDGGTHTRDFVFRKTRGYTGIVTDEMGRPVANATVQAEFPNSGIPNTPPREVQTETDGSFEITPPGKVPKVILIASDQEGKLVSMPQELEGSSYDDNKLVLRSGGLAGIVGTVIDEQGDPIPDAMVDLDYDRLSWSSRAPGSTSYTDETGSFSIERVWPGWSFQVDAQKFGYFFDQQPKSFTIGTNQTIKMNLVLRQPSEAVDGIVIDHERKPVAEAKVSVRGRFGRSKQVDTNKDGSFRIDGLFKDNIEITVTRITPDSATRMEAQTSAEGDERIELTLPRCDGKIGGVIVDEQGAPLRNARLFLLDKERSGSTDERGRFEIDGIMPGETTLTIYPDFSEHERGRADAPIATGQMNARIVFSPKKKKGAGTNEPNG